MDIAFQVIFVSFVGAFAAVLVTAFGLALSHLQDAAVIAVGVVALVTAIVAVVLQGLKLRTALDARDARDMSESGTVPNPDASVVRSYSLSMRPDYMKILTVFPASSLVSNKVQMTESASVACSGAAESALVSFVADASYFVVAHAASSDAFHRDVVTGLVSSIMISGTLLRIVALVGTDFPIDVNLSAQGIYQTCDIYTLSARGPAGSTPVDKTGGCTVTDIYMPWSGATNVSATSTLNQYTQNVQAGVAIPVQVWGIGGR